MVGKVRVDVKVPDLYEFLVRKEFYGLLVAVGNRLLYFPFNDGLSKWLKREKPINIRKDDDFITVKSYFSYAIHSVLAAGKELYVGLSRDEGCNLSRFCCEEDVWGNKWEDSVLLFDPTNKEIFTIDNIVQLDGRFKDMVVVGEGHAFYDISGDFFHYDNRKGSCGKQLIPYSKLASEGLGILSVAGNDNESIFLHISKFFYDYHDFIVRAIPDNGEFELGDTIFEFDVRSSPLSLSRFLGKSENGTYLFLSNIHPDYLVINDKEIVNSNVKNFIDLNEIIENIHDIEGVSDTLERAILKLFGSKEEYNLEESSFGRFVILDNDTLKKEVRIFVTVDYQIYYRGIGGGGKTIRLNDVWYLRIDYSDFENPRIVGKPKKIITGFLGRILEEYTPSVLHDLTLVKNRNLHEELLHYKVKS